MNWVIKFNQLEKEGTDKLIDIIAEYQKIALTLPCVRKIFVGKNKGRYSR